MREKNVMENEGKRLKGRKEVKEGRQDGKEKMEE